MGVYSNDNLEGLDYRGNDIYSPFFFNEEDFMKAGKVTILTALVLTTALATLGFQKERPPAGEAFLTAANGFLETLNEEESKLAVMDYDTPERVAWHFIPKDARKGLVVKDMNMKQRRAASQILRAGLSFLGYKLSLIHI